MLEARRLNQAVCYTLGSVLFQLERESPLYVNFDG